LFYRSICLTGSPLDLKRAYRHDFNLEFLLSHFFPSRILWTLPSRTLRFVSLTCWNAQASSPITVLPKRKSRIFLPFLLKRLAIFFSPISGKNRQKLHLRSKLNINDDWLKTTETCHVIQQAPIHLCYRLLHNNIIYINCQCS